MKEFFQKNIAPLEVIVMNFPWRDRLAYSWFLSQTYHYVCHSTRLLALSAARFTVQKDKLHRRFLDHIREERSHEILALNDLKHLGHSPHEFPELSLTRTFYEPQYYKIEFEDPTALFGYILALEGISVKKMGSVYPIVAEAHGEKASTFLKVHADEDIEHIEKAFSELGALNQEQIKHIEQNFQQSCEIYGKILITCSEFSTVQPFRNAKTVSMEFV